MAGNYLYGRGTLGGGPRVLGQPAVNSQPSLTDMYEKMSQEALTKNTAREQEIRNIYADILTSISGSESSLRASGLKDIENQANKLTGQQTQNLISSGLYGTTTAAAIPKQVATEFTQPSRMKLEDLISQKKQAAQLGLAGFVERIQNPYPDYNTLVQAMVSNQSNESTTKTINSYPGFKYL